MSSDYHLLCLDHEPALVIPGHEYDNPFAAIQVAADPMAWDTGGHGSCDLLVGRYSASLAEIACPRCETHGPRADTWIEVGWLRLLHAAYSRGDDLSGYRLPRCWTRVRVLRLSRELGI